MNKEITHYEKVRMKDCMEEKPEPVPHAVHSGKHSRFKKKSGKSNIRSRYRLLQVPPVLYR